MPVIKHLVLLKFKPGVTDAQIREVFAKIEGLKESIAGIIDFTSGPYSSPEGLNQGFTHGFITTFESAAARDAYLPHPEHERVKSEGLPLIDAIVAFDFEAP